MGKTRWNASRLALASFCVVFPRRFHTHKGSSFDKSLSVRRVVACGALGLHAHVPDVVLMKIEVVARRSHRAEHDARSRRSW